MKEEKRAGAVEGSGGCTTERYPRCPGCGSGSPPAALKRRRLIDPSLGRFTASHMHACPYKVLQLARQRQRKGTLWGK